MTAAIHTIYSVINSVEDMKTTRNYQLRAIDIHENDEKLSI